jgi:hypothetical protein
MSLREDELQRARARRAQRKQRKRKKRTEKVWGQSVGVGRNLGPALAALLDDRCLTFREWCQLNGIGERTGRRILKSGNGPVVTQLTEKRIGITVRANRAWQASRERAPLVAAE